MLAWHRPHGSREFVRGHAAYSGSSPNPAGGTQGLHTAATGDKAEQNEAEQQM